MEIDIISFFLGSFTGVTGTLGIGYWFVKRKMDETVSQGMSAMADDIDEEELDLE